MRKRGWANGRSVRGVQDVSRRRHGEGKCGMSDVCEGGWVVVGARRRGEWMMVVPRRKGGAGSRWRERCEVKRLCAECTVKGGRILAGWSQPGFEDVCRG